LTASDHPKRPGRPRKPLVARALRRARNKDQPVRGHVHLDMRGPLYAADEAQRIDLAIDAALVNAQTTITTMVINVVRHDTCDHMALFMLQDLTGRVQLLRRLQTGSEQVDLP